MNEIIEAMEELNEPTVLKSVKELRANGITVFNVLNMLNSGMLRVGKKFEQGEYFLADLILSGIIYRNSLELLGICEPSTNEKYSGKVLIGVVKDDIHDIGKDIIVSTLLSGGFDVNDLGTDVRSSEFVSAALEFKPDIIALSGTMSYSTHEMHITISRLRESKVCESAKILVGGICISREESTAIGADFYSENPIGALSICREIMGIDE